ncbi:TPA: hypothetical protein SB572_001795, partial [Campylobacter coli]|nr:hypothetical protein [Campylobacter coli]
EVLFEINFAHKDDFNNDILTLANKYWLVRKERKYQIFNMKDNKPVSNLSFDNIKGYDNFISVIIADRIGIMDE